MKKVLMIISATILVLAIGGCNVVSKSGGFFSNKVSNIDEPQTDDERTFVGEYNDYLLLVDSLAEVWDGTDTLTIRRLYYNQREQQRRVEKMKDRQNIRHSLVEKIIGNVNKIWSEIQQKFPPELRSELYSFYELFNFNRSDYLDYNKVVDWLIYENSYGEHYFFIKKNYYDKDNDGSLVTKEILVKRPLRDGDIELFMKAKQYYSDYRNNTYHTIVERATNKSNVSGNTDWDATEIDWCEKCEAKDYSCCPKCKGGEQSDCECKCEICIDLGNVNGN